MIYIKAIQSAFTEHFFAHSPAIGIKQRNKRFAFHFWWKPKYFLKAQDKADQNSQHQDEVGGVCLQQDRWIIWSYVWVCVCVSVFLSFFYLLIFQEEKMAWQN